MRRLPSALCLAALLTGCAEPAKPTAAAPAKEGPIGYSFFPTQEIKALAPSDPPADPRLLVSLTVYKLTVPARTVSHSDEFWKHVNEEKIDVTQHDILFANGFRVGVAPRDDWDYFRKILERDTVVSQISGAAGVGGKAMDLPFKVGLPEQTVLYLHPTKGLIGQVYGRCDESLSVHFEPVPRTTGAVRITAVPYFRSQSTEIAYTARNEAQPYSFVRPEYLFDLQLKVDVPPDNFMVVAPSAGAERESSLGRKLLCSDANGQQYETVLIFSPQPFEFDKPTVPATQPGPTAQLLSK